LDAPARAWGVNLLLRAVPFEVRSAEPCALHVRRDQHLMVAIAVSVQRGERRWEVGQAHYVGDDG